MPPFKTRIKSAAIRWSDGTVITLPPPHRHHDIILHAKRPLADSEQGFVTDRGEFVTREEAFKIAQRCGQMRGKPAAPPRLFTEDMW